MLLFFLVLIKPQSNDFWIDQDSISQNGLALPEKGNSQYPVAVSPQAVQYIALCSKHTNIPGWLMRSGTTNNMTMM